MAAIASKEHFSLKWNGTPFPQRITPILVMDICDALYHLNPPSYVGFYGEKMLFYLYYGEKCFTSNQGLK